MYFSYFKPNSSDWSPRLRLRWPSGKACNRHSLDRCSNPRRSWKFSERQKSQEIDIFTVWLQKQIKYHKITSNGLKWYRKRTFTGHNTNLKSFVPWYHLISCIRSYVYSTKRLCNREYLKEGIQDIKKLASWNGFHRNISNRLITKFVNSLPAQHASNKEDSVAINSRGHCSFIGSTADSFMKLFYRRIVNTEKNIKISTFFKTSSLKDFVSFKDRQSSVIEQIGCSVRRQLSVVVKAILVR